jgi:hypothetical protein
VTLYYEGSPTREDGLFTPLATIVLSKTTRPLVTKLRLADNPSVPLARWLRWKLVASTSGDWSVTFRILAVGARAMSVSSFDAASLPLTGWWRASYSASPWTGSESTGSSGLRNLAEGTNPPSAGTSVNGFAPADFDGTNDRLSYAGNVGNFFSAGGGSIAALVNIDAINTSLPIGASITNNDGIFADDQGYVGLFLGGASQNEAQAYLWDGSYHAVGVTVTTGSWQLLQMRWDGTRLEVRLNNGSWSSVLAGNLASLAGTLLVGSNVITTQFFDGKMLELMFADRYLGGTDFDRIRGYLNARYALSV